MAYLEMYRDKLKHNYDFLDDIFKKHNKEWAVVTKLLCGNEDYLRELLKLGVREVCDSRISNLKRIKELDSGVQTVYIKPPAQGNIEEVVRYADVTFNSESAVIRRLSEEAQRQGRTHKVTIMIELGDLREGIMGDHLIDFYESIFELPNIEEGKAAGEWLLVGFTGEEPQQAEILATLIGNGFRVAEFKSARTDLEGLFMAVTKGAVQ